MLVDFAVKNFGPFKDEAVLTMTAQRGNEHPENYIETKAAGNILTSAAVFGPNASGKTYLIDALGYLRDMILFSGLPNASIPSYMPFRLSKDTKSAPTVMNIRFIFEGVLYDYHISYNAETICEERLFHYPNGKRTEVFTRVFDKLKFGRSAKGASSFSKVMSPNTTCVFTAAQFNNVICKKVYDWFHYYLIVLGDFGDRFSGELLKSFVDRMNRDEEFKKRAIHAMGIADFPISDIHGTVIKRKINDVSGLSSQTKTQMMMSGREDVNETELFLIHDIKGEDLAVEDRKFPVWIESAGTIRFLSIIGPILDTLAEGRTLIIDEFGQKLHSKLSRWIVEQFCDRGRNTGGGQLIFNTQNTYLMDQDIFRRDQIYLADKNDKGESELFSISDFGERKDRVILASYMDGKYGAIPFIDEGSKL